MSYPQGPYDGYPPPYPPRRNKRAVAYVLGGIAAAVAITLALVLALSGQDSPTHVELKPVSVPNVPVATLPGPNAGVRPGDNAIALAAKAAAIIEQGATSEIDELACTSTAASELRDEVTKIPTGSRASVDDVRETMSQAQARITLTMNGQEQTVTLEMKYVDSHWCASGI
jgi:hypothetical protein